MAERLKARQDMPAPPEQAPPTHAGEDARAPRLMRRHVVGGGLLAASLAALAGVPMARRWLAGQDYATRAGERRDIRLADGSVLHLNTTTRVRVRFDADHRAIDLLSGEASFDVAHDRSRPFDVRVGDLVVRAVGTRFAIRMRPDQAELTVTEGKVAVRRDQAVMGYVAAGNGATLRGNRAVFAHLDAQTLIRRTAWQDDAIELDGDTVAEALAEFNRYRDTPILIGDPRVAALRVGGRFDTRDAERFVVALQQSFPIRATHRADGSTILLYGEETAQPSEGSAR